MTLEYVTFQKFADKDFATDLTDLLTKHNIGFVLEDSGSFDPTFVGGNMTMEYRVKLLQKNFQAANQLYTQLLEQQLDSVDKDHYLFEFTDEELIEIITKPDEWNHFDYLLSQKILKDRGKEIKPEVVAVIKNQRTEELVKPAESQREWVIAGYIFAFFGGIMGIFIGWHLYYHKKTLPNGERVYAYFIEDRKSGFNIFIIGIICSILWIALRLMEEFK